MTVKPTKMRHAEEYQRGNTRGVEERNWAPRFINAHAAMHTGRAAMAVRCPFCAEDSTISPMGVNRGGQRCSNQKCLAIFVTGGKVYRLTQETADAG